MENQEKQNTSEPNFKIFNEEVGANHMNEGNQTKQKYAIDSRRFHHYDHRNRNGGVFGLLILFLGVLFLSVNLGLVSRNIWLYIIPLWPVLLILFGFRLILGETKIARFISFVITLIILSYIFMNAWVNVKDYSHVYQPREFINLNN